MIITCPSCGTRYRRPAAVEDSAVNCSCSRCEAVFPSDTRIPNYAINRSDSHGLQAGSVPMEAVLAVGARLDPEPAFIATPVILPVDSPVPGPPIGLPDMPIGMDDPTLESIIRPGNPIPVEEAAPLNLGSEPAEEPETDWEEPEDTEELEEVMEPDRPGRDMRPGFGAFMVVTCLPTAMAAGAWQLSTMFAEDPMIWTTPAGVLGLLFSWLWVRWKYRER